MIRPESIPAKLPCLTLTFFVRQVLQPVLLRVNLCLLLTSVSSETSEAPDVGDWEGVDVDAKSREDLEDDRRCAWKDIRRRVAQ
jgi:hypothetical protein